MLRIRVTSTPQTYHYWGGEWEVSPTFTGFGTLLSSAIPIVDMTEAEFDVFKTWVNDRITARLEDIAAAVNG